MSRISLLTLMLLFGFNASAVMPVDQFKAQAVESETSRGFRFKPQNKMKSKTSEAGACTEERLVKLARAIEDFQEGAILFGEPAIKQVRFQMRETKKECGGLRIDPDKFSDDSVLAKKLRNALDNKGEPKIIKASAGGPSVKNVISACFLFVNLICPDGMLTGSETITELKKESAPFSRDNGTSK